MTRIIASLGALCALLCFACDAADTAKECVAADLIGQCPVGSNPVLGAQASNDCGGTFDGQTIGDGLSVTGQCGSNGSCEFLCQFAVPCTCGVATLTKEEIVCAECPTQSCGDSRCEGTERPTCEPGQSGCQPCPEDCAGATCGDGDCTGEESPATCPQDCAQTCTPNASECLGTVLRKCSANGRDSVSIDCADSGMVCQPSSGQCVPSGTCGNEVCDAGENATGCPQDCGSLCQPNQARCEGNTLVTCSGDGKTESRTECGADGQICSLGACRPANVCGNLVCETAEEVSCPGDCARECGDHICQSGEDVSCPADCVVCGNQVCEADEQESCPQDCGVCTPSSRECLGDVLRVCTANGVAYDDFECGAFEQICARGACQTPGKCGNGACEDGEDETSCAGDCRELCGNGTCGVGESFDNCSIDCPPVCGDGSCNGDERPGSCPSDCLSTCGNAACDGLEDRDNCPGDCGFCGNGVCEDGAESPKVVPPPNQESCLADCVVSQCQNDGDCDDEQACTTNRCVDGTCAYQPNDAACGANQKCIKFNGCCADKDKDGYADEACGGSDCDDADADIHPGAFEPCGGGDRNCNGAHKPTLKPAKKLTDTFSLKSDLAVAQGPNGYLATWTAVPEQAEAIEYVLVTKTSALDGPIRTVPTRNVRGPHVTYSPTSNRFALLYYVVETAKGEMNFVAPSGGALELSSPIDFGALDPRPHTMAWVGDVYFIANHYGSTALPWRAVSEAGGLITTTLSTWYPRNTVAGGGRLMALAQTGEVYKLDPANLDTYVTVALQGDHKAASSVHLGWDGALMVWAARDGDGVTYERFFPNGFIESTALVTEKQLDPVHMATAPAGGGDPARVGVLLAEGTSNLYLFVRNQDGSEALPPGLIGGGSEVTNGWVFWDGQQFVAFWLAKVNQIKQLYTTTVSCE